MSITPPLLRARRADITFKSKAFWKSALSASDDIQDSSAPVRMRRMAEASSPHAPVQLCAVSPPTKLAAPRGPLPVLPLNIQYLPTTHVMFLLPSQAMRPDPPSQSQSQSHKPGSGRNLGLHPAVALTLCPPQEPVSQD